MSDKFVILHLSDAHLGNPKHALDSLNIFEPLFKDLKEFYQTRQIKPSIIVFSGDLAYGDIPEKKIKDQYSIAKELLTNICACFAMGYGDIPILLVPGNHDIDRNLIDEGQKSYRETSLTEENVAQIMQDNEVTWKRILERQKEWYNFVSTIPNQPWKWYPDLHMATGIIIHQDKKIGIAGLNSSWASHEEKETGKLWIGKHQYDVAYHAIKEAEFRIVVSHHPIDWLNPDDKKTLGPKIETQFNIYLHGHEHVQWFNDSDGHLKCAAGACYNGTKKPNGYSWLVLDFNTQDAAIYLREYTDQGKGGWRPNQVPDKTDRDGVSQLSFLKGNAQTSDRGINVMQKGGIEIVRPVSKLPDNLEDFLRILQDRYYFRWERGNIVQPSPKPLIYWPVRLRQPTPIHAAQCFVAAGLQKLGCKIFLWIDDLGNPEYSDELFTYKLKDWYKRVGGNESNIVMRRFTEILSKPEKHIEPAWEMLQQWLGTMVYYTDRVLKIAKIWPSTEDPGKEEPEDVLKEISKRRPRRLMTPSMVWTCLLVLHRENNSIPIITLGGYDENELWDAWRKCCDIPTVQVGHLYVPKLTRIKNKVELTVHMSENRLAWQSKDDVEEEFGRSLTEIDSHQTWSNVHSMIPWTINNCALLPNFIANSPTAVSIGGRSINKLDDLKQFAPSDVFEDLVRAVTSWLL